MTGEVKTTKLYRPVYKEDDKQMNVTFYDGSKMQKMVLENKCKEHKVAQELVKFFNQNATKNNGKIPSGDMLSAWLSAQAYLPLANDNVTDVVGSYHIDYTVLRAEKTKALDNMIKTACMDNSEGGSDVVQKEQFAILKALANWFTKV